MCASALLLVKVPAVVMFMSVIRPLLVKRTYGLAKTVDPLRQPTSLVAGMVQVFVGFDILAAIATGGSLRVHAHSVA